MRQLEPVEADTIIAALLYLQESHINAVGYIAFPDTIHDVLTGMDMHPEPTREQVDILIGKVSLGTLYIDKEPETVPWIE